MGLKVIGRGTWLDKVAWSVIEREKGLGRSLDTIRVESGIGASGIPHVGSLGDAVRAYGIRLALEDMGYRSELIAYSDDMDGLRKVPRGMPEWLERYIAHPVSSVPDPFGCHGSYGTHMSGMLIDALERLGIEFRFQSGTDAYRRGMLKDQIDEILKNARIIGRKIAEMMGQRKFEEVLPYFPICEGCGRIYLAQAYSYVEKERRVLYRCEGARIGERWVDGCGHEGEASIDRGDGKLSWKGEFAARWVAFDVRFEAYGKDIADSVRVNDWISDNILGFPHPYHVMYELFLDKSGRKISKSIGNVFTPQAWLRYGGKESLMLLMFKRIAGTRHLSIEDIPRYMDEYEWVEDVYFGKIRIGNRMKEIRIKGIYEYIHHLKPPSRPSQHAPYRLLVQLCQMAPEGDEIGFVIERLKAYGMIKGDPDPYLLKKIELARNWANDFPMPRTEPSRLRDGELRALEGLLEVMKSGEGAEGIQNAVFELARANGIEPPGLFRLLYTIYLGSDRGPRFGRYVIDMGIDRAIEVLEGYLKRYREGIKP